MKNMYLNLTQMLQGCSKRNGMTVSASNPDGEPTVNRQSRLMSLSGKKAEKEQLSPSCLLSASFPLSFRSRYLRYAAVIFCVLAMSMANVGTAWGANITVTPYAPTNITSIPYGLFTLSHSSTAASSGSKISSGAITTGTNGDVITIHFETTKSDIYIKSITFNSLSNGTLSSSDGTISSSTFTASSAKNAVDIVLTSDSGKKGTVKITNVVIDPGTNDIETITFTGFSSPNVTFSSSAGTSALTSITKTSGSDPSVSSNILTWPNSAVLTFSSSRKITYIALQRNDGKNDSFTSNPTGMSDFAWSGNSNTVAITNSAGGGRPFAKAYVIIAPAVACGETAQAALTLSSSSGSICGTGTATFTVSGGSGSGALSVASSDETKATASIDGSTVTVTGVAAGSATITVTKACDATYAEKTATYSASVVAAPTANAGADKVTEPGTGVALAATAAADGCTGAWTIQSGQNTSTAQLSSTSSATATFTPTVAGTYTLRWTVTNTSSSCSAYDEMKVTAAVCSISDCGNATLTYPLNVGTSLINTAANLVNTPSNGGSAALTVPAANAAVTLSTITISDKDGKNENNGKAAAATNACYPTAPTMSSKIGMYNGSSYSSSNYLQFAFTVNSGYTFTPCDIQFTVQPVSNEASFRWEVTDGTNIYGYGTENAPVGSGNGATVLTGLTSTSEMEAGDYYIRLYPYYNGSNTFRISNNVILKGTTASAAPSCSDETGLAYGETTVNKVYGDASFTNTLTNSNSLSVLYSSSNTDVATVNPSTGAVTIKAAGTATITASWAGDASYCEDEVSYTLNVKPNAVVDATNANGWRYSIGETIDLTCTATGGSSYTYQWQKYTGPDTWTNLSNGTDGGTFSGVTTNRLQISGCTSSNGGSYRCVVTANGQTKESNAYVVYIFTLNGNYDDDSWTENAIVWTGANTGRATINLAASRTYKFKVTNNDGKWFGCNTGVTIDMSNWTFRTNEGHCVLTTGGYGGGAYTFDIDISYAGDNNISVSVTYPKKTTYLQLCSDWKAASAKYAIYYWKSSYNGWTGFMTAFACDGDVLSADVPVWATNCTIGRFNTSKASTGNWDDKWNQTGDLTLPTDSKDYYHTLSKGGDNNYYGSWGTYSPSTYTITFAGNGNTGGSMSSLSSIACDADQQITANAFEKTGYTFANWTANVDVKVGGATVSAGSAIANSATIQNIRGNIALTAQWSEDKHSVTVAAGSNGTVSPSSVSNIGIATASGDITATANTGYHFTSWTLPSGTSAASTYSESSNPIRINATADGKTITANFSANTPTITLDDQDATNTPTGSVVATYGSSMPEIATLPTKTGYTFGGFYSDVAGGGTQYYTNTGASAKNSDLASATTLYALWTQSVTIDDNGGSADGSVSVTYNGTAGTPSVPTYAGHTVDLGYYAESSCTNKVMALDGTLQTSVTDGSSVVWTNSSSKWAHAGSSTLYAHWKCNTPEISCSSNTITISVPSGATVYYTTTTNGSDPADPTSSSTAYNPSSKPTISADTKIKAIAIQSGCTNSAIASASLTYVAAGTSYYLFTPTSAPVHAGDLSGQFVTDASAKSQEKTILEYTFPSYLNGVGTATSMSGRTAGSQGIQYYAKTSTTKFIIYYGVSSSSSTYKICIGRVSEGETSVTSTERSVSANDLDTIQYEFTSTKNTTFSFHINNNNIWIYQIVAIESGTDHKQAGEPGYDLSFNKGRIALDNSSTHTITAEGLTIKSTSNFKYTDATALSLAKNDLSNNQISFTTPASPGDLKLTWSGGQMAFNTSASAEGATDITSGTAYSLSGSTKYYLINTGGSASSVTKLQFVTAATTHSVSVAYNGSGSYGTAAAASTTVGEGSTTTITASPETGYQVNSWEVSGTGSSLSDDGSTHSNTTTLTMGTADATVTCTFGAISYTLAWSSNGGSDLSGSYTSGSTAYGASITAPNNPTLSNYTFDGWKTNNDGTGTTAGSTMPAAATTYYAAWKQTVTLKTGAQGSGADQTPYVYINGTGVSSFTAHTADGYTLQGYYTAGSGGVKVLNANGTFAAANVTDYITSSKWSRTGAAPTLYAQWVASEDCSTSDFVIRKGDATEYQGCMESSSYNGTATSFTAGSATTVGNAKMTISNYDGGIKRPGEGKTFSIVIEPVSGYYLKSICWAGKVEDDETVSYYWDDNSGSAITISPTTTSGTGVTYNAPSSTTKFTASYTDDGDGSGGIWWRNVQVEVCAAGGTTYSVTYDDNDATGGTAPTDADSPYDYGTTVTVLGNTGSLAKTNYTFAGWTTNDDGTGSSYVADNTFSITANTTLYAKWTQAVTFDANTANHGSTGGSATAVWNATGLTGITHATPASGYKLLGYYTAATEGTKVINSDGTFAETDVTDYITDGKWSRTSTTTLYAQYEVAGSIKWNLQVNSADAPIVTSSKNSSYTQISTSNMRNLTNSGLTVTASKKSELTSLISTPDTKGDDCMYVTFKVATGYKFTPSLIKAIIQPVGNGEHKAVEFSLADESSHTLASASATKCDGTEKGKKTTVTLAGDGTYFTGTVTLKIFVYKHADGTNSTAQYRLGTPIQIDGAVEATCTMPSYESVSYSQTEYTVGDTPSSISVEDATGDPTYQWKYNSTGDRSSGTNGVTTASMSPSTASAGTTYYWCELANACGTVKTPAVAITVSASKSDAPSIVWTDPASTPNYGGGGYTLRATVNDASWDGSASGLTLTAPAGIRIYNTTTGTDGSSKKYIEVKFDVQTAFDRETYSSNIPFTVSADATTGYNAISADHNVSYSACSGGGGSATEELMAVDASHIDNSTWKGGWVYDGIGMMRYGHGSSDISAGTKDANLKDLSYTMASGDITKYYKSASNHFGFYTEKAITGIRLYVYTSNDNVTVSNVYVANSAYTSGTPSSGAVSYEAEYNDDNDALRSGTHSGSAWVDITFDSEVAAKKYGQINLSNNVNIAGMAFISASGSGATLTTTLAFASSSVTKAQSDANFTITPTKGDYSETLGAITYSSSNTDCATVNATTGEVTITATGSSNLTSRITATLAASGCYKSATAYYDLTVTGQECTITSAGTLSADKTVKCSSANVTLTLSGEDDGMTVTWYRDATDVTASVSDHTLTTSAAGSYSVVVSNATCSKRSNSITISNYSAEVAATKIVDKWYIKNGRVTPDIALWALDEGTHLSSVAWSPSNGTGLTAADFYESDGIVYLKGKEPSSNESSDVAYTLTLTVKDECENTTELSTSDKQITLTHQKNTDKHVLAFVVTGTEKGGWTAGISADQTTNVELYNEIAKTFDVQATNIYSTDDEQKLKEYYSQFDILCITDYPNTGTKGVNKKSYVDAIGSLIDIRPILTMEAFVSKLDNWKSKGISGTPKSPTTRQYSMLLQCKDHEIFSGTNPTTVGSGDETMYRIDMVDKTLEDYVTLDATYGAGTHAEKSGYEYGSKPALQGFTYDASMSSLLPIGRIDDGAGNDLEVGVERQEVMEARLLVLGINSYAMERLDDDGQTIVINALKYLMRKDAEDISDCSNYFLGGAEGDETNWFNTENWSGSTLPDRTQEVRIVAPCVISDTIARASSVKIVTGGTYSHGTKTANGSLTINPTGSLIVEGKIYAATAPNFFEQRATEPEDLVVKADDSYTGTLIFDNEDGETQATIEMYSKSYWETVEGKYKKYWSYVGMPIKDVHIPDYFYGAFTYYYNETKGWERRFDNDIMQPFEGIGLSMQTGHKETFYGTMVSTENVDIKLTSTTGYGDGDNLIGNSWTAPIQIANFDASDFGDALATIYIFNTGREGNTYVDATVENKGVAKAGQWLGVPISVAGLEEYTGLKVVPAMNAFLVYNDEGAGTTTTMHLDYEKLVRDGASSNTQINEPMRAPSAKSKKKKDVEGLLRIRVVGEKTNTDVWMMQDPRFSEAFDNGWEAYYTTCDDRSAQLYARSSTGKMSFLALPDLDGTVLGFAPSRDGNNYTFTFKYRGEDEYYLNDLKLQQSVLINADNTYDFIYEKGDANRFYISRTPLQAPQTPTGIDNTQGTSTQSVKAIKVIYNDKLYIIRGGRVYSADGSLVK